MIKVLLGTVVGFLFATWGMPLLSKKKSGEKQDGVLFESRDKSSRIMDDLSDENEKLRRRTKEMQQEIDELTNKNLKLSRQLKEKIDAQEEASDDVDTYKKKVFKLETRISQLESECREWEIACNELKSQLNK